MQQLQFGPTGWLWYSCFFSFFQSGLPVIIDLKQRYYVFLLDLFYFFVLWGASLIRFIYSASNQWNRYTIDYTFQEIIALFCAFYCAEGSWFWHSGLNSGDNWRYQTLVGSDVCMTVKYILLDLQTIWQQKMQLNICKFFSCKMHSALNTTYCIAYCDSSICMQPL